MSALPKNVESIHPSLWRGSQLARAHGKTVDSGYAALSAELPGGGWPLGTLIELLVQQPGVGEFRLLRPALAAVSTRPIALVQPPLIPNSLAFSYLGLPLDKLMRLQAVKSADALWSAEQILKTGSCGALLLWMQHVRAESLRRLHLAAQSSETLFLMVRPLASAADSSPATLRLGIRAAGGGIAVDILKRKGPVRKETLSVILQPSPVLLSPHGRIRRHLPTPAVAGGVSPALVA
ncbi:translesion DNA synthesis-associated protein ImuA [Caballeronia glathei]|uniref:Recombinase RecA n=1 Tax=Caballeronia glathei TaxID=60547 RepID=A0A069PIU5_9BURK|nr:translesion DNA synthesis-associated protein ImuA [Caballeronia glathei]KDR40282.1 recombinase RecA [Caballeronia glathei]